MPEVITFSVYGDPGTPTERLVFSEDAHDHPQYALVVISAVRPTDPRPGTIWIPADEV